MMVLLCKTILIITYQTIIKKGIFFVFQSFSEIKEDLLFAHLPESLSEEEKEVFRKKDGIGKMYRNKENNRLLLSTGEGYLEILEIQVEGKKRLDTPAFLLGFGG